MKPTKPHFDLASQNQNGQISIRKASKIDCRSKSNTNVVIKARKRIAGKIKAKFEVLEGKVVIDLPIRTMSEANSSESWRAKHRRRKEQKFIVTLALKPLRGKIKLPCEIMLTRFAPQQLDKFDNLPMSFKYIADAVCEVITGNYRAGQADRDQHIQIACDQVKSNDYGIRIEITHSSA